MKVASLTGRHVSLPVQAPVQASAPPRGACGQGLDGCQLAWHPEQGMNTASQCCLSWLQTISPSCCSYAAAGYGDNVLGQICGAIASDEGRHEIAYSKIMDKVFEL